MHFRHLGCWIPLWVSLLKTGSGINRRELNPDFPGSDCKGDTDPEPLDSIKADHESFSMVYESVKTWIETPANIVPASAG